MKRLLITAASNLRNSPLPSLEERELCACLKAAGLVCDGPLYVWVFAAVLLPAPAQLLYWSHTEKRMAPDCVTSHKPIIYILRALRF